MSAADLILLAVFAPLVGAFLILVAGEERPNLRDTLMVLTSVATFACVASILPAVLDGELPRVELLQIVPGLPIAFEVEPLGMLFALIASFLWIVTSFYAIGYMRGHHEEKQTRFFACFAIAISAALGVAFSANMFTLFIAYEVLTLSTYPLVVHNENHEAQRAGRTYLGILLSTSICFQLVAIIWTWMAAGTLDFTPGGILAGKVAGPELGILLFLYMYGIGKAALMPIHRWLPAAMVAPTPVSALLHAVAVVKAGVFTVLKVIIYIFGPENLQATGVSEWLLYVAGFTVIAASCIALTKNNLKARLAYSTVSQLSYIVLGAALATPWALMGAAMHIAMHAFGKITLFFCAGAIMVATHKTEVSQLDGLGRRMPFTMGAFLIGALCVIGIPPLGGFWSKWHLVNGAFDAGQAIVVAVFLTSTLLNVAYLLPPVVRAFLLPPKPDDHGHGAHGHGDQDHAAHGHDDHAHASHGHVEPYDGRGIREAPLFCVVPLCLTAVGGIALFFFIQPLFGLLYTIIETGATVR
ncbi:MAG: monovalent cation/H+ antiporter subunit D family protein [Alphaproteobacteria bacterium]